MALLDQLFRLRGAPATASRPVTLGALVDALPKEDPPSAASEAAPSISASDADAPAESGADPIAAPSFEPATVAPTSALPHQAPISEENAPQTSPRAQPAAENAPKTSERRPIGVRFNPFAPAPETPNGGDDPRFRAARPALGPCLDDPGLPPLRLEPQVIDEPGNRVFILGTPPPTEASSPETVLRQIDAPAIRLSGLKPPPHAAEQPPATNARPLKLRLEIEAEAALDVVAFKQHAAKFPGVVKCVISNAGA